MKIRVIIANPGKKPVVTEIENTLTAMQAVVGGYIDCLRAGDLDLWVNDEGLLMGLPFNVMVNGTPLVGPILVAASNREGDTIGLTDAQVARALSLLSAPATTVQA